jgi:hypothetical protein
MPVQPGLARDTAQPYYGVPRELALGPLLTVQREKAPPRPPVGAS